MMNPTAVLKYVKSEPFRPFRLHMASGKTYEVRHPEMLKVGKTHLILYSSVSDNPDIFDDWDSVSLMLMESISYLEAPVS